MKNLSIITILLISLIIDAHTILSESTHAVPSMELGPNEVYPGDVFTIRTFENTAPQLQYQGRELPVFGKNKYYQALAYVNIDTKPGIQGLTIKTRDNSIVKYISVLEKNFPVKYITLESDKVFLNPKDEKRADKEEHILESLWNTITPDPLWTGSFTRPIDSSITSEFGVKRIINGKKESRHRGTDYKGSNGTPIKSINSGVVVLRDNHFYGGNTIVINHGIGLYSAYLHLSRFMINTGDSVSKGQVIGLVGNTGRASGPHLHLSVKLYGESINPESLYKINLIR